MVTAYWTVVKYQLLGCDTVYFGREVPALDRNAITFLNTAILTPTAVTSDFI